MGCFVGKSKKREYYLKETRQKALDRYYHQVAPCYEVTKYGTKSEDYTLEFTENEIIVQNHLDSQTHYLIPSEMDDCSQECFEKLMNRSEPSGLRCRNPLKRIVSKKKRRYTNGPFDLDLAYITKRIVAFGFPAVGIESLYRNSRSHVREFIRAHHPGAKIYNLCIEPEHFYEPSEFGNPVSYFPFFDHNVCPLEMILDFCVDAFLFLTQKPENTLFIHCKAGKGRTGVMICSLLIFLGLCRNTAEAVKFYGQRRTMDGKGITIQSQLRYVEYFETFLSNYREAPYYKLAEDFVKNPKLSKEIFKSMPALELKCVDIGPFFPGDIFPQLIIETFEGDQIANSADVCNHWVKIKKKSYKKKRELDTPDHIYFQYIFSDKALNVKGDLKFRLVGGKYSFYIWISTHGILYRDNDQYQLQTDLDSASTRRNKVCPHQERLGLDPSYHDTFYFEEIELAHCDKVKGRSKVDPKMTAVVTFLDKQREEE